MILHTKFNEGDNVWTINPKTAEAVPRTISGVRTQSVFGYLKTIYCFVKDCYKHKSSPTVDDCFWLSEDKIFQSKEELLKSL